jgi:hypothetical protein
MSDRTDSTTTSILYYPPDPLFIVFGFMASSWPCPDIAWVNQVHQEHGSLW